MESPFNNGASWADQWDDNPDPFIAEPKKGRGGGGMGKKVGKGLGKTKAVASSGVKKVKKGTCIGFGWIKGKCHKTPQTLI